jgi:uncharacterized protein (DUF1501 family)
MSRSDDDPTLLDRRRFLLGALAATGAIALPGSVAYAAVPPPPMIDPEKLSSGINPRPRQQLGGLPPSTRQLVLINLGGGCDGVNTFVGPDLNRYRAVRKAVAVPTDRLRSVNGGYLHPSLGEVQRLAAAGRAAILPGLGVPAATLSHFSAAAQWMAAGDTGTRPTGWLGRALDSVAASESFAAVHLGSELPLLLRGTAFRAVTLPDSAVRAFGADRAAARKPGEPDRTRVMAAVEQMALGRTDGTLASQWARGGANAVRYAGQLSPALRTLPDASSDPTPVVVRHLQLAGALINLNAGVRVVSVLHGGFDTHSSHLPVHERLLAELDAGLARLFTTLSPAALATTAVLVVTEFGRRVIPNASFGLDHGGSYTGMLLGAPVVGGLKAQVPSLDVLDSFGNQPTTLDVRRVFAESLTWLGLPATVAGAARPYGLFR